VASAAEHARADLNGRWDLVVVGAGIVGLAAARELLLRRPGLRVAVVEREAGIARHQTGSNSGVIHSGIYYRPGSLKAKLCVDGARRLYAYCDEHAVPYERCGKVIVALEPRELAGLGELEARGRANRVPGLRRIGPEQLRELEPHATGIAALHSPQTGIVDFGAVAQALAAELRRLGVTLLTGCEVLDLEPAGAGVRVRHATGELLAGRGLVCAGAWTDRLATRAGAAADPRIVPFRGAYLRLRPGSRSLVRSLIYPVPDPKLPFLGVHLTRRIDREVWLGPTALLAGAPDAYRLSRLEARSVRSTLAWPGTWRMMGRHWRAGVAELRLSAGRRAFVRACAAYVPELAPGDVLPGPAGVRAQAVGRDGTLVDDFVVDDVDAVEYVRNAPSPAATSALAIAVLLADRIEPTLA
jgi:2-hydroxyglutarate dehydrogenase